MENTDKTIIEMQQQMQQLREKLESQKIVNERILRNSYSQSTRRLRLKSSIPIIAGTFVLFMLPFMKELGLSTWFLVFTGVMMAACIVASALTKGLIPDMSKDLVSATQNMIRFRNINRDWIKFGVPSLVVWSGLLFWDMWKNTDLLKNEMAIYFITGFLVGAVIGVAIGLKNRRDILNTSDSLLEQIDQLKK